MTPSDNPPQRSEALRRAARGLSLAGLVLLVLFLSILVGSLLPLAVLDPAWQLRLGGALINTSPFPLIGLGLLVLAVALDPADRRLVRRQALASRLAVAVAVGYLLLAPLLTLAAIQQQRSEGLSRQQQFRSASIRLQNLRQAAATASSVAQLEQSLAAQDGPRLDAGDRLQPLPLLRSRMATLFDQAAAQLRRSQAAAPGSNPLQLLPEIGRTWVASLALACGFAGLARRQGSDLTLLDELRAGLARLRLRSQRSQRSGQRSNADYLRQLRDGEP